MKKLISMSLLFLIIISSFNVNLAFAQEDVNGDNLVNTNSNTVISINTLSGKLTDGSVVNSFGEVFDKSGKPITTQIYLEIVNETNTSEKIYHNVVSSNDKGRFFDRSLDIQQTGKYEIRANVGTNFDESSYVKVPLEIVKFYESKVGIGIFIEVFFIGAILALLFIQLKFGLTIQSVEPLRFAIITLCSLIPIIILVAADVPLGQDGPFGIVPIVQEKMDEQTQVERLFTSWHIHVGGNPRDNYTSGILIPVFVLVFGLLGGFLRFVRKMAQGWLYDAIKEAVEIFRPKEGQSEGKAIEDLLAFPTYKTTQSGAIFETRGLCIRCGLIKEFTSTAIVERQKLELRLEEMEDMKKHPERYPKDDEENGGKGGKFTWKDFIENDEKLRKRLDLPKNGLCAECYVDMVKTNHCLEHGDPKQGSGEKGKTAIAALQEGIDKEKEDGRKARLEAIMSALNKDDIKTVRIELEKEIKGEKDDGRKATLQAIISALNEDEESSKVDLNECLQCQLVATLQCPVHGQDNPDPKCFTCRIFVRRDGHSKRYWKNESHLKQRYYPETNRAVYNNSMQDISLIFLPPILAFAVYFILAQAGISESSNMPTLAAVSIGVGLVTKDVLQKIESFTRKAIAGENEGNGMEEEEKELELRSMVRKKFSEGYDEERISDMIQKSKQEVVDIITTLRDERNEQIMDTDKLRNKIAKMMMDKKNISSEEITTAINEEQENVENNIVIPLTKVQIIFEQQLRKISQ